VGNGKQKGGGWCKQNCSTAPESRRKGKNPVRGWGQKNGASKGRKGEGWSMKKKTNQRGSKAGHRAGRMGGSFHVPDAAAEGRPRNLTKKDTVYGVGCIATRNTRRRGGTQPATQKDQLGEKIWRQGNCEAADEKSVSPSGCRRGKGEGRVSSCMEVKRKTTGRMDEWLSTRGHCTRGRGFVKKKRFKRGT